jgi:peptidoglycan lytic transglycosylase
VRTRRRALVWLLASVVAVLGADDAWPAARHHVPTHLKYASAHRNKAAEARHYKRASERAKRFARLRQGKRHHIARKTLPRIARPFERVQRSLPPDLAAVKQALELVQQGKLRETTVLTASIGDPVAQKLVEWALLRHAQSEASFERYAAFIRANPDWPSIPLLRRRAEVRLWQEPRHAATARRFLAGESTSSVVRQRQAGGSRDSRWR